MRDEVTARLAAASASGQAVSRAGTLDAALDELEAIEKNLPCWVERRSELRAWSKAEIDGKRLGAVQVRAITEQMCRRVMAQWGKQQPKPVAPKTTRQRRWSLQHLYRVLYGAKTITPVDDIAPPAKVKTIPVPIDPGHVLEVLGNLIDMEQRGILRDAKTRARFMVRASTGKRPSEIMRAKPSDVRRDRREWRVRDGKGGFSEGLYLNDEMLAAWDLFFEAHAWGEFNTGAHAKTLRSAGWAPDGDPFTRPYELRHSTGIALSDAGVDLADISPFLGHKQLETTRRTYVPIRNARMQRASEVIDGRFNGWKVPAAGTKTGTASK
jgi:integrase